MARGTKIWAKNCHLYAPISEKLFSESKSHSLNAAHEHKTAHTQKKLVHTAQNAT